MSAWIVFPVHISFLVACALELAPDHCLPFGNGKRLTPQTFDEIWQLPMGEQRFCRGYPTIALERFVDGTDVGFAVFDLHEIVVQSPGLAESVGNDF